MESGECVKPCTIVSYTRALLAHQERSNIYSDSTGCRMKLSASSLLSVLGTSTKSRAVSSQTYDIQESVTY